MLNININRYLQFDFKSFHGYKNHIHILNIILIILVTEAHFTHTHSNYTLY